VLKDNDHTYRSLCKNVLKLVMPHAVLCSFSNWLAMCSKSYFCGRESACTYTGDSMGGCIFVWYRMLCV
jgi:hypothetical protein